MNYGWLYICMLWVDLYIDAMGGLYMYAMGDPVYIYYGWPSMFAMGGPVYVCYGWPCICMIWVAVHMCGMGGTVYVC